MVRQVVQKVGGLQSGPALLKLFQAQVTFLQDLFPGGGCQRVESVLQQEGIKQGDIKQSPAASAAAAAAKAGTPGVMS